MLFSEKQIIRLWSVSNGSKAKSFSRNRRLPFKLWETWNLHRKSLLYMFWGHHIVVVGCSVSDLLSTIIYELTVFMLELWVINSLAVVFLNYRSCSDPQILIFELVEEVIWVIITRVLQIIISESKFIDLIITYNFIALVINQMIFRF